MTASIEIKNFHKRFGAKEVHKGVSIEVKKGECLGLIGGSGSGKSVILRSIIGLERPDEGQIKVLDKDVTSYTEEQFLDIRKRVAYCFQNGALFDSMTVFDNVAYPLVEHTDLTESEIKKRVIDLLDKFGLSGNEDLFPSSLSGGMQKRLGVARAIVMNPEIILYDEPTSGLDPFNTRKVEEMIKELKTTGVSSILVTHDMGSAFRVCDRIVLLMNGKIIAQGAPEALNDDESSIIQNFMNGGSFQ
jgi:phospholipid/cholesterol/gamma-HCH transport system ATP-binding protein